MNAHVSNEMKQVKPRDVCLSAQPRTQNDGTKNNYEQQQRRSKNNNQTISKINASLVELASKKMAHVKRSQADTHGKHCGLVVDHLMSSFIRFKHGLRTQYLCQVVTGVVPFFSLFILFFFFFSPKFRVPFYIQLRDGLMCFNHFLMMP